MSQLHTSDCFSFNSTFVDAQPFHIFESPKNWLTERFECSNGLSPGDFASFYESSLNIVSIQPSMAVSFRAFLLSFRPLQNVLKKILDLHKYNGKCASSERRRFDSEVRLHLLLFPSRALQDLDISCDSYTLIFDPEYCTRPIYTRHPISHEITKHENPYPGLPPMSLPAHPTFVVSHAYFAVSMVDSSDILVVIGLLSATDFRKEFREPSTIASPTDSPPNSCPGLTHSFTSWSKSSNPHSRETSSKRKRDDDELPHPAIATWLEEVVSERFDDVPTDDVGIYASEPSKSYDAAIVNGQDWIIVSEHGRTKKKPRWEIDANPNTDIEVFT